MSSFARRLAVLASTAVLAVSVAACSNSDTTTTSGETPVDVTPTFADTTAQAPATSQAPADSGTQEYTDASLKEVVTSVDGLEAAPDSTIEQIKTQLSATISQMKDAKVTPAACKKALMATLEANADEDSPLAVAGSDAAGMIIVRAFDSADQVKEFVDAADSQKTACTDFTMEVSGTKVNGKVTDIDTEIPDADASSSVQTESAGQKTVTLAAGVGNVLIQSTGEASKADAAAEKINEIAKAFADQ